MCGICGYISKKHITEENLIKMNNTMYHRGTNDSGAEIYPIAQGYSLGLAQRRLSILDLSELGHQPMHSKDKRISVVYNGEIYNYLELKEELSVYPFVSNCDTEVIIAAYLKWGVNFVEKLNGMFAIALFDKEKEELFLYRDRMGKKPLYYYLDDSTIAFASELKPIMSFPYFKRDIDQNVLGGYLYHRYICGEQSIFQNVYRLEPGSYLAYKYGIIKKVKYWDITERYHNGQKNEITDYETAKADLKELLKDSVKKRMIADVPLGTFLSGGYDSSLVTAIAQELSDKPVKTFGIGFQKKEFNEAPYANKIAEYLGTDHTELYISEEDMLFCGYTKYEKEPTAQKLDVIGGMIRAIGNLPLIRKADMIEHLPYRWRTIVNNKDKSSKTQYGNLNYIPTIGRLLGKESENLGIQYDELHFQEKNWQKRAMLLDQETYLPDDILCKVDRATMKYSLEARCPILDYRVVEYSYSLPQQYKCHKGDKKHILKDIAYDYLPKELLNRPKQGFAVPIDKWLRGSLKDRLTDYSSEAF